MPSLNGRAFCHQFGDFPFEFERIPLRVPLCHVHGLHLFHGVAQFIAKCLVGLHHIAVHVQHMNPVTRCAQEGFVFFAFQ